MCMYESCGLCNPLPRGDAIVGEACEELEPKETCGGQCDSQQASRTLSFERRHETPATEGQLPYAM
jgi:hypothetical protein